MIRGPLPGPIGGSILFRAIWKLFKKALEKPKSKYEAPEDVIARNQAYQEFCDHVRNETKQIEDDTIRQLDEYGRGIVQLINSPKYLSLTQYGIRMDRFLQQIELLKMQIPGLIASEVSRDLSDGNPECVQIRKMFPGTEKDVRMKEFLKKIVESAVNKCVDTVEKVMQMIQEEFVLELKDRLTEEKNHLEQMRKRLKEFDEMHEDLSKREAIKYEAKHIQGCCLLILNCLEE